MGRKVIKLDEIRLKQKIYVKEWDREYNKVMMNGHRIVAFEVAHEK